MNKIYVIFFYFLHLINVQAANTGELNTQELIKKGEQAWEKNDFAIARQMFFAAAQAGDCVFCYNYALCLKDGIGGEKNVAEAIEYFKKAIAKKKDFYQPYEHLADIYQNERNTKECSNYLGLASKYGSSIASCKL